MEGKLCFASLVLVCDLQNQVITFSQYWYLIDWAVKNYILGTTWSFGMRCYSTFCRYRSQWSTLYSTGTWLVEPLKATLFFHRSTWWGSLLNRKLRPQSTHNNLPTCSICSDYLFFGLVVDRLLTWFKNKSPQKMLPYYGRPHLYQPVVINCRIHFSYSRFVLGGGCI